MTPLQSSNLPAASNIGLENRPEKGLASIGCVDILFHPAIGAVAQLVRAPDCRSGGCGFESRPRRFLIHQLESLPPPSGGEITILVGDEVRFDFRCVTVNRAQVI